MARHELTDKQWELVENLLPRNGDRGGQWQDHRRVLNGMLWRLSTGCPWRDLPPATGHGRPFMTDSTGGAAMAHCSASARFCGPNWIGGGESIGPCGASTAAWFGPTSQQQARVQRAKKKT